MPLKAGEHPETLRELPRKTRAIWRELDCSKSNSQSVYAHTHRYSV
jgi:hypothetical protein